MLNLLAQTYTYTTTSSEEAVAGGLAAGVVLFLVLIGLVLGAINIVAMWKVFEKAGVEGWKAIIPVYNLWVLMEISGKPGWWALLNLIPYAGGLVFLVLYIMAMLELAKRFGKDSTFAVLGLVIFSMVGFLMLAFGDAKYSGTPHNTVDGGTKPPAPAAPVA